MTIRYRLYLGMPKAESFAGVKFWLEENTTLPGFSLYPVAGYWEAKWENSMVLEYLGDHKEALNVHKLAYAYASHFKQKEVLMTTDYITTEVIRGLEEEPLESIQATF